LTFSLLEIEGNYITAAFLRYRHPEAAQYMDIEVESCGFLYSYTISNPPFYGFKGHPVIPENFARILGQPAEISIRFPSIRILQVMHPVKLGVLLGRGQALP
jgi:hypothetical protein